MNRSISILVIFFGSLTSLFSYAEDCDFYRDKSQELGCSTDGYLLQFGDHYCRAFEDAEPQFSPNGVEVLKKIRPCLIGALASRSNLTCQNVREIAEESHVACYLDNGFCSLSSSDKRLIFQIVHEELLRPSFKWVAARIQWGCLAR